MKKEKITIAEIDRLASLSELEFTTEEKKILVKEVSNVIDLLNDCAKVSTSEVVSDNIQGLSSLREDEVDSRLDMEDVLLNAPKSHEGYFVVPKVVE